jgi:hypothetical protein
MTAVTQFLGFCAMKIINMFTLIFTICEKVTVRIKRGGNLNMKTNKMKEQINATKETI